MAWFRVEIVNDLTEENTLVRTYLTYHRTYTRDKPWAGLWVEDKLRDPGKHSVFFLQTEEAKPEGLVEEFKFEQCAPPELEYVKPVVGPLFFRK